MKATITDEQSAFEREIRRDETERCALLAEQYAGFHKITAAKHRVPRRGLIFRYVPAFEEQVARLHDACQFAATNLARYIRAGYDPRKDLLDPNEKIDLKTGGITGGAGREPDKSPAGSAVAGDALPSPAREPGAADNIHGPQHWYPCADCADPMDCGSWASCFHRAGAGR